MSKSRTQRNEIHGPDGERLRREMLEYLETHHVMTIASCAKNIPWAAAVFYASDGFDLYFLSNPKSRHGTYMAANPRVSAAIHEDYSEWREIRGIQLEGKAERLRSLKLQARFWEVYLKKFPFVKQFFQSSALRGALSSKLAGIRLYRIVPSAVWYIDNRRGFGHREMLDLTLPARRKRAGRRDAS
jgi:uncharacterized protein YhbP (UPF0306 family)